MAALVLQWPIRDRDYTTDKGSSVCQVLNMMFLKMEVRNVPSPQNITLFTIELKTVWQEIITSTET